MKINCAKICIPTVLLILAGCNKSEKSSADDTAAGMDNVTTAVEAVNEELPQNAMSDSQSESVELDQKAMLQELLTVDGGENEDLLRKCCTRNALKQLNQDYEYDDYDENSLAIWAINGRPYSDLQMVLQSINKVGPNTYQVEFKIVSGAENKGKSLMEYKLADENGQWKIDSYKQISCEIPD